MKHLTEIEELKSRPFPENYVNRKPHSRTPLYSFERIKKAGSWYGWNIEQPIWEILEVIDVDRWTQKKIGFVVHKTLEGSSKAIIYKTEQQEQIYTWAEEPFVAFELAVNEYCQIQK
jgi:hypothetical protein